MKLDFFHIFWKTFHEIDKNVQETIKVIVYYIYYA